MLLDHPLLWLALLTFIIVVAFAAWSLASTRRRQRHGPNVDGVGSHADPMVGEEADTSTPYMQGETQGRPNERRQPRAANR